MGQTLALIWCPVVLLRSFHTIARWNSGGGFPELSISGSGSWVPLLYKCIVHSTDDYWAQDHAFSFPGMAHRASLLACTQKTSSPEEGNGNPLPNSCLESLRDRGAWQATVPGVAKNRTRLSNWPQHTSCQSSRPGLPCPMYIFCLGPPRSPWHQRSTLPPTFLLSLWVGWLLRSSHSGLEIPLVVSRHPELVPVIAFLCCQPVCLRSWSQELPVHTSVLCLCLQPQDLAWLSVCRVNEQTNNLIKIKTDTLLKCL